MSINFPFILLSLTAIAGVISLIDIIFWAANREKDQKPPVLVEYSRSFFGVLLVVLIIRSFVVQPYRVPTGSLEPTVLPGDFIVVNQFAYGLRLPVWEKKIISISEPKRGDIVVFHWPGNPKVNFVKRVIGLPGDHISYIDKTLYINGTKASQKVLGTATDIAPQGTPKWPVNIIEENLSGIKHKIYQCKNLNNCPPNPDPQNFYDLVVPKGQYLMMGDNRDNSEDSRIWGFVPEQYLVGKAFLIFLSWDSNNHSVRWHRIGNIL